MTADRYKRVGLARRAIDAAERRTAKEDADGYQVSSAVVEAETGNRPEARAAALGSLTRSTSRDVRSVAALALARSGESAQANELVAGLSKDFPLDTRVQKYWLPCIRAAFALEKKDAADALDQLKTTERMDLGSPSNIGIVLYPAYLRGEAFLLQHNGGAAAPEFQKFIDHYGLVANFPLGALARLGLARSYALQSHTAKARSAYQNFLSLWKDADPDAPILRQARSEWAKF